MKNTTDNFWNKLPSVLSTREAAQDLFLFFKEKKTEEFNLRNVEFVSRSFANEWFNLEKKHKKEFIKTNMNPEVEFMFRNASKKMDKKQQDTCFKYSSISELIN